MSQENVEIVPPAIKALQPGEIEATPDNLDPEILWTTTGTPESEKGAHSAPSPFGWS